MKSSETTHVEGQVQIYEPRWRHMSLITNQTHMLDLEPNQDAVGESDEDNTQTRGLSSRD